MRRAFALWKIILAAILCGAMTLGSCRSAPPGKDADGKWIVFAGIAPVGYFVERIGGEHCAVEVLVGPGESPHTYTATMKQMARLERAKVFVQTGVPFEQTLLAKVTATHKDLTVVDLRKGLTLREMCEGHHGHDHDHHAHETDPHTWLAPKLAMVQARTICDALCDIDPDHAGDYRRNLAALLADLELLDREIAAALKPLAGKTFYVFHPAFGYFAAAYGLTQKAVETGGVAPDGKALQALIDEAKAAGVRVIFVQPQFSDRAAKTIARQIGGAVVPIDPLARDYPGNLRRIADAVRKALKGPRP